MKLIFSESALKELKKLASNDRQRIIGKLKFYLAQSDPLIFVEPLKDHRFGEYRFRIGNWRILFDVEMDTISVLKIGHRRDVYR